MTQQESLYTPGAIVRMDDTATNKFAEDDTIAYGDGRALIVRFTESHGPFHLVHVSSYEDQGQTVYVTSHAGVFGAVYKKPHPSTTPRDVLGAYHAHHDGEFWHFAPCSEDEHIQMAADLEDFAYGQFVRYILKSNAKCAQATSNIVRSTAFAKSTALLEFAEKVGQQAHDLVTRSPLGHYHGDPHRDHRRALTIQAVDWILYQMRQAAASDWAVGIALGRVQSEANSVKRKLGSQHDILRRAVFERRRAAAGADPVGGNEYIFAKSSDGSAITGAANLPDPAWVFDNPMLSGNGLARGNQTYYDGEQDGSSDFPWAIRFTRPIVGSPAAGASMGAVAWTQEAAYRVYDEEEGD